MSDVWSRTHDKDWWTTVPQLTFWQKLYIPEILRGMAVTTRHFVTNLVGRRHTVTQQYPEQPTYVSERYRGRHRLMRKEDGSPRCTSCMLCATSCPALCIHIQAGAHPDPTVEKYPISFTIDELRCNPRQYRPCRWDD